EDLAGDIARSRAREKQRRFGDFVRLSKAAERNLFEHCGLEVLGQTGGHIGLDKSGGERIDSDTARGELARGGFRKANQPGFTGGVIALAGVADQADHRSDVDDSAGALLEESAAERFREKESAFEVGI